jgi:hypothetical protein
VKQTAAEQNSQDRRRSIHREKWDQEWDLTTKYKRERQQVHDKDRAGKQKDDACLSVSMNVRDEVSLDLPECKLASGRPTSRTLLRQRQPNQSRPVR